MVITKNQPARTDWFPVSEPPARPGVYEVEWALGVPVYAKYSHGIWHFGNHSAAHANRPSGFDLRNPPKRWRGLAANPKAAQ